MEVTGKLHAKFDEQDISASFKKRDFVLEVADNPQYPQYVIFQFTQEKCGLLDTFTLGQEVTVMFNLRGRAWTSPQGETKYFNTLEAWAIRPAVPFSKKEGKEGTPPPVVPTKTETPVESAAPMDITKMNDSDDLPF